MTAEEAGAYGLIDDIIMPRRGLCAPDSVADPELQAAGVSLG